MSLSSPCFCSLPPNLISFYRCLMLPSPYPSHSVASYIPIRIVSTKGTLIVMLLGSTSIIPLIFSPEIIHFPYFPPVPVVFFHQQTCPRLGFLQPQPPGIFGLGLAVAVTGRTGRCLCQGAASPGQVPASQRWWRWNHGRWIREKRHWDDSFWLSDDFLRLSDDSLIFP